VKKKWVRLLWFKTEIFATEAEDLPVHTKAAGARQNCMPMSQDCHFCVSNEERQ